MYDFNPPPPKMNKIDNHSDSPNGIHVALAKHLKNYFHLEYPKLLQNYLQPKSYKWHVCITHSDKVS